MNLFRAHPSNFAVVLLLVWSGCLPHSCQRTESRAVFPADSLSRALSVKIDADTLELEWSAAEGDDFALSYPRTLQWTRDGRSLYVSDVESGRVVILAADDGAFVSRVALPETEHPYLAGWKGDLLAVLDPDAHRVHYVQGASTLSSLDMQGGESLERSFVYGTQTADGFVVKTVRKDRGAQLLRLSETGRVRSSRPLEGPYWRHAGFLRLWGDSLISLCGYRPVLDVVSSVGSVDSLSLRGFDSPMLNRSRLFVLGEVDEPPLLYASAAPAGPYLFVLNMRPGSLRVDAYDRDGRLRHVMVNRGTSSYGYYPVDLAVHRTPGGDYVIAVAVAGNSPRVDVYRWRQTSGPPES